LLFINSIPDQEMLESGGEAGEDLIMFHVKLLRKLKKSVTIEKWEKGLTRLDANL